MPMIRLRIRGLGCNGVNHISTRAFTAGLGCAIKQCRRMRIARKSKGPDLLPISDGERYAKRLLNAGPLHHTKYFPAGPLHCPAWIIN